MSGQERKTGKRVLNVGLLAHVDAGKTTLSESILYQSGAIRNLGRVDHQDAFLDTDENGTGTWNYDLFQAGGAYLERYGDHIAGYTGTR